LNVTDKTKFNNSYSHIYKFTYQTAILLNVSTPEELPDIYLFDIARLKRK